MKYTVMAEDWQTEDEIYTFYTLEEAAKQAHYMADRYGVNVDMYAIKQLNEFENEIVSHIEIKPSEGSKPSGNYYWDHKGKYQFASMMQD